MSSKTLRPKKSGFPSNWPVNPDYWWNASHLLAHDLITPVTANNGAVGGFAGQGFANDGTLNLVNGGTDATLKTNQVNGLPAVQPASGSGFGDSNAVLGFLAPYTIYVVAKLNAATFSEFLDSNLDGSGPLRIQVGGSNNTTLTVGGSTISAPDTGGAFKIYQFDVTSDGTNSSITVAGVKTSGTVGGSAGFGQADGIQWMDIVASNLFAELAVFSNLSAANKTTAYNFLKGKYHL